MITWATLRSSAAPWLLPPAFFYLALYIDDAAHTVPSGYGVESGELAAYGVVVIAPVLAGAAAWESGRHRLMGAVRNTGARRPVRRLLRAAAPALLLHLLLVTGVLVMARGAVGVWPGGSGWLAAAHLVVLPLGWLVIGWSLGEVLPRSVAAPVAGIGCWTWLAVPHATGNAWVRHLGGFIDGTSSVTDVREPAVYAVPWLVVACLALACRLPVRPRRRAWAVAVGGLVAVGALAAGRLLVADWGHHRPTSPRSVAPSCTGEAPRVCVPPEYEPYAERLRRDALAPLGRLRAAGVAAPRELRITSAGARLEPGTWPLYWSLPARRSPGADDQYAANLAQSAVAGTAVLAGSADCRQPGSLATAWAALVIGVDERAVRQGMPAADWAALRDVRRLPAGEQSRWFHATAGSGEGCGPATP
ncbi:hypothetical protein LUW75_06285 [Streptomyces sp. MRC013]|uniref:DUF7224 domain-containing protein n=1 Tax=Streptomyces sp. MRC013 TaxID=2898276 RepID=UPI002026B4E2|nr:hypothetical protein [Streptomyces sp. MRC013]URM89666.1 hypothetical protein LUW75_06285 [Streptomyces sp. MRC013]